MNECQLKDFAAALDRIRERAEASIGQDDVDHVNRIGAFSRAMEVTGRLLIHFSLEPVSFATGVFALWLHKQLEATEIGHPTLHGAYDKLEGADRYRSATYQWDMPIDEKSWQYGHNVRHHQYTNIGGKDPDIHFGGVRLTEQTPLANVFPGRVPLALLFEFANFGFVMNAHFTGLIDVYFGNGRPEEFDFIPNRSREAVVEAHKNAMRKYVPYYLKNYVFYPALAGPFFAKVLFGNWLAETMRDVYSAATIYCGHTGDDVASYPEGTKAHGRGEWYRMQIESTNDFNVSWPVSVLCGALDKQIEHHLFPKLPPNRLREIAPEVRKVCEEFGVTYRSDSWRNTLKSAFDRVLALGRAN